MTPRVSIALLRTQSDQRLLELMQAGHEAAFEAIVERYRAQLHRYARRMLPEGRCEDAVQQGLMQAWRALQEGKEVRQLRFRARSAVRAAATAVTPLPFVTWVARAHSGGMGARIGEAAAGAGAVAGGAHVLQTGTALIVAGTLAVGGATALQTPHSA